MSYRRPNVGPVTRRLNKLSALQALESPPEEGDYESGNESDRSSSSYAGSEGSSSDASISGGGSDRQTSENGTLAGSGLRGESSSRAGSWAYDHRQWKEQMLETMTKAAAGALDRPSPEQASLDQAVAHQAQTQGLLRSRLVELNQVLLQAQEAVDHIKKREKECLKAGEKVRSILESTHKRLHRANQLAQEGWPIEYEMVREQDPCD